MSPIISVKQTGHPARRARKRQRRRGVNSTEGKISRESGVERLRKEGIDRPWMRAVPQDIVMTNTYNIPLLSPATNAVLKTSSTNNEPKNGAVAHASKQPDKNDIVLAPPQSAFTFSCSRSTSTTVNVRGFAGSQRKTPVRGSAARSPLPKPPTSSARLLGNGQLQGEERIVRREAIADKVLFRTETMKPGVQSNPYKELPLTQAQPDTSVVGRDLALAHTNAAAEVPCGWPIAEPLIMAPATKDRKSRFLPALSRMVISDSESSTGGNEAVTGMYIPEIVTSPVCYTDALEHQTADITIALKHASSHGSTDSGYVTKSGSPSIEVSPTWSHSPSSEHDWEGRDAGFWMRQ